MHNKEQFDLISAFDWKLAPNSMEYRGKKPPDYHNFLIILILFYQITREWVFITKKYTLTGCGAQMVP